MSHCSLSLFPNQNQLMRTSSRVFDAALSRLMMRPRSDTLACLCTSTRSAKRVSRAQKCSPQFSSTTPIIHGRPLLGSDHSMTKVTVTSKAQGPHSACLGQRSTSILHISRASFINPQDYIAPKCLQEAARCSGVILSEHSIHHDAAHAKERWQNWPI